jgi:hypothetical protein
MAKELIKELAPHIKMYRDDKSGLVWIADGTTGCGYSCHPNISITGSVSGMKSKGYWGKKDRIVRTHGFQYNVDILATGDSKYDNYIAEVCECVACKERRSKEKEL